MGTKFELIADAALRAEDPEYFRSCQVCGLGGVPVYVAPGQLIRPDGTVDEEFDLYAVCEACLKAGRVRHTTEYLTDPVLEGFTDDPPKQKELLRTTPCCPRFFQDIDWPICCRILTEYTGEPSQEEARVLDHSGQYWERGPAISNVSVGLLVPSETLSVMGGVSAFRCRNCAKKFWIFQYT